MPRFNSINFYQNRPKIKLFLHKKLQKFSSALPLDPQLEIRLTFSNLRKVRTYQLIKWMIEYNNFTFFCPQIVKSRLSKRKKFYILFFFCFVFSLHNSYIQILDFLYPL